MHVRSETGIWKCNGCSQLLPRDTTFIRWMQGRKSNHKKASARRNSYYDKDEQTKENMQRATTRSVMKTQTHEPVKLSTQTTEVNILCPQCRGQTNIDMAKCWETMGRHRFIKERCTECKTHTYLGNWLRCKDENEQTILGLIPRL